MGAGDVRDLAVVVSEGRGTDHALEGDLAAIGGRVHGWMMC